MAEPGRFQRLGSRVLSGLGLTRKRHYNRLSDRIAWLEGELDRLRSVIAASGDRPDMPPGAPDLFPDPSLGPRDLSPADKLAARNRQLEAALRELDFRTARWRACAEGRAEERNPYDHGFRAVSLPHLGPQRDRPTYKKALQDRPMNSGLTGLQAYHLEVLCLTRLQQQGSPGSAHFPALVQLDPGSLRITMTHQGRALNRIAVRDRAGCAALIRHSFPDQLALIVRTLEQARIVHLDVHPGNIVIDEGGCLSLIDFDIATADDLPFSAEIARRHTEWQQSDRYAHTLHRLTHIVTMFIRAADRE